MPRAFFLFPIAFSLLGQSSQPTITDSYATTDDGSQLYFLSNFVLRNSTGEGPGPKLFKYDGTSFSLALQIPYTPNAFYAVLAPLMSGDGSVTGYIATQGCGNSCNVTGGYQTTLQFPGSAAPLTLPYYCRISRNAQYALCVTAQPSLQQVAIVNLSTMQMSAPQLTACHGRNLITSDGRALAWNQQQIVLFSSTGVQQIASNSFGCPVISDDGSMIVYPSHQGLIAYNVATGSSLALIPACNVCNYPWPDGISNDGALVSTGGTLFRTDGSGSTALNTTADILSGNGMVAYSGLPAPQALLKIDVPSGAVTQIAAPTPVFSPQGFYEPGSYYVVQGQNLSTTTETATSVPGPNTLAGVQVLINGTPIPLFSVSPTAVAFQIPWETPLSGTMALETSTGSQFIQGPVSLTLTYFWPVQQGPAINQNFTALNSLTNPANPGDIVNFYLSGLGPVTTAVADWLPTPASPLPVLANQIAVTYGSTPLKVYYAGLAPGLIGIYQLTVQTPAQLQSPNATSPLDITLSLNLSPPQTVVPYSLNVVMNPNQ